MNVDIYTTSPVANMPHMKRVAIAKFVTPLPISTNILGLGLWTHSSNPIPNIIKSIDNIKKDCITVHSRMLNNPRTAIMTIVNPNFHYSILCFNIHKCFVYELIYESINVDVA